MALVSTTKKEKNIVELEIQVSGEEFKPAVDRAFKKNAKNIAIPGFRKGKAPRPMIEKMYGEGIFFEDAINELYPKFYSEAADEAGIEPVDKADVEILNVDKNDGFTFKATVTVKPEVKVVDYKGIKAVKKVSVASDEDVDKEIDRLKERNARLVSVEGRAALDGDSTVIDYEGFVDGEAFAGGKGEDHTLILGSNSFIPGFEEQIVGKNAGDSFDVNVTFPEEYHAEELKGKPAVFKVTLKELKTKEYPVLDDEFAKDVSEFDTLAELRADLKSKIQEARDKAAAEDVENQLVSAVVEKMEVDLPPVMVDSRINEMVRDFEYRLQSQGMKLDLYLQYTGMDMESFRKTFAEQAERQVKTRLALEQIAKEESLSATSEEIEAELQKMAESYKVEAEKLKGIVSEKDLTADIAVGKAIDLVRDNAVIEEVEDKPEKSGEDTKAKAKPRTKKAVAAERPDGEKPAANTEASPEDGEEQEEAGK